MIRSKIKLFIKDVLFEKILKKDWFLFRSKLAFSKKKILAKRLFLLSNKPKFNESDAILYYFIRNPRKGIIIDVGAYSGSFFSPYVWMGWEIYAFEPDPNPKKQEMLNKYKALKNVHIFECAISNRPETSVPLYASTESNGISSLHPFRNTHKEITKVKTITLTQFIKDNNISHVDLLKVDAEGYDYFVIQSLPWSCVQPDVIMCEYEDRKTKNLGYSYKDLGDYLLQEGYHVYLSEWYPILKYGREHKWKSIRPYPLKLDNPDSWGNLIAFREKPSEKNFFSYIRNAR